MTWLGRKNKETASAVDKLSQISDNLKMVNKDLDLVVGDLQKEVKIREQRRRRQTTNTADN